MTDDEAAAIVRQAIEDRTTVFVTSDEPGVEQPYTPVYEIRVYSEVQNCWTTLAEKPAGLEPAMDLAAFKAMRQTPIPGEVLVVGEWGPVARWVDGQPAALESLTPGHPGGCTCGECAVRWSHREGRPGHEPCGHGRCVRCDGCTDCDWDAIDQRMREFAAAELITVGNSVTEALPLIQSALNALRDLDREVFKSEMEVDGLRYGDAVAANAKLIKAAALLEDVARIVELCQLRAKLTGQEG